MSGKIHIASLLFLGLCFGATKPLGRAHAKYFSTFPMAHFEDEVARESGSGEDQPFKDAAAVIEKFDVEIQFQGSGTYEEKRRISVKIHTLEGLQDFKQLYIPYHSEVQRVHFSKLQTVKPDGRVFAASTKDPLEISRSQELMPDTFTDDKFRVLPTVALEAGDRLEYEVTLRTNRPLKRGDFWMTYFLDRRFPILEGKISVAWPSGRQVLIKTNEIFSSREEKKGNKILHSWHLHHLAARDTANYDKPLFSLSTLKSWAEMGLWYRGLLSDSTRLTSDLKGAVQRIIEGKKNPEEQLEAIYAYVSTEIRYLSLSFGRGGIQPHRAQEIWRNRYGDCKDKHALLAALLSSIDIPCYPGFVRSGNFVQLEIPNPEQFDHVISVVPLNGKWVWLDTTVELAPVGFIPRELRGRKVLVITPNESRWLEIPYQSQIPEEWKVQVVGSVDEAGNLQARFFSEKLGQYGIWARAYYSKETDPSRQKPNYDDLYPSYSNENAAVVSHSDVNNLRDPFQVEVKTVIPRFIDILRNRQQVKIPTRVLEIMPWNNAIPPAEEDPQIIPLMGPCILEESWELDARWNYQVVTPPPLTESRDFARYESNCRLEAGKIIVQRRLEVLQSVLPAGRRDELESFQKSISENINANLVWERLTPLPYQALAEQLSPDALSEAGRECLNKGLLQPAFIFLQKAIQRNPQLPGVWNNFGRLQLSLGHLVEAKTSFIRQIELNPRDLYAYQNLGLAMRKMGKLEEAVSLFKKQLDVSPQDRFALGSLAATYLEQRHWREAETVIQKAIAVDTESQYLFLELGQAQLCQGRGEEAGSSFEKALEKDSNPNIYHGISWALCECGGDLKKAQHYVESSIKSVEAIFQLQGGLKNWKKALPMEWSLLVFLDTLGWVHYLQGDLTKALPLLLTSHENKASADTALHLALLQGKRGKWPEAQKYYREAILMRPGLVAELTADILPGVEQDRRGTKDDRQSAGMTLEDQRWWRDSHLDWGDWIKPDIQTILSDPAIYFVCILGETGLIQDVTFFNGDPSLRPLLLDQMKMVQLAPLTWGESSLKSFRAGKIIFPSDLKPQLYWAASDESFTEVWMKAMEAEGFKGY
jgi:tetratricopeptide (TPR) repeat protein